MPKLNNKKSVVNEKRRKRTHKKTMRGGRDSETLGEVVLGPGEHLVTDRDSNEWGKSDPLTTDVSKQIIKQGGKSVGLGLVIAAGVAVGSIFLIGALKKH